MDLFVLALFEEFTAKHCPALFNWGSCVIAGNFLTGGWMQGKFRVLRESALRER